MGKIYSISEAGEMINSGKKLLIAGDASILTNLPKGEWIGGSIPYFMGEDGGLFSKDKVFIDVLPDYVKNIKIKAYDCDKISEVYNDGFANGISFIILPAFSEIHSKFSLNAPSFENFAMKPLIGWISGLDLSELGKKKPIAILGSDLKEKCNEAVVMHAEFPENKAVEIGIVNIFKQSDGDVITFPEDGFTVKDAMINGELQNFAKYLSDIKAEPKSPLVADYSGAMINTSFQAIDAESATVSLYAPVFKGIEYKLAESVGDYLDNFQEKSPKLEETDIIAFSCNCILNYLYCNLENKKTGKITGPITFGEIAYQLLNQTMVYAKIINV